MAVFQANDLLTKPRHMGQYGDAVVASGVVQPTAAAANDVFRPCIIPAGTEVNAIILANDDLDASGTPALAFKMGFSPVNASEGSLAADSTYFAAAGDTTFQSANNGKVYARFAPIKFEQDVFLDITVTAAAATFASGKIYASVLGTGKGVK